MLWFIVWTVLVLAAAAGGFWLGRDLWRKGRALLAELERAGDVARALEERTDALTAAAEARPIGHDVLGDPDDARRRLAEVRARRHDRRAVRAQRHAATFGRWRAYTR